jgi:RNA polymerase sigma-70 factor (ECF subfamily)
VQVDADRLSVFVATDYRRVVGAVALMCGDTALAEDAVQEALARACEQEDRDGRIENWAAWVTTVAMNQCRSTFRRRGSERRANSRFASGRDDTSRIGETATVADAVAVRAAVAALPTRQREAIVLRSYLGYSVGEVAAALEIADGTAKALLYQARHRLADALAEASPEAVISEDRP